MESIPRDIMKPTEIAALIGVKYASLAQTIRRQGVKKYEGGYSLSEVQAAKFRAAQKDNRSPLSADDPRRLKVELENQLLKIKIDEAEGKLVDAEQISQDWQRVGLAIKNDLLALPQSLAPRLAGKTDLAEISLMLDGAIRDALRHLADKVKDNLYSTHKMPEVGDCVQIGQKSYTVKKVIPPPDAESFAYSIEFEINGY